MDIGLGCLRLFAVARRRTAALSIFGTDGTCAVLTSNGDLYLCTYVHECHLKLWLNLENAPRPYRDQQLEVQRSTLFSQTESDRQHRYRSNRVPELVAFARAQEFGTTNFPSLFAPFITEPLPTNGSKVRFAFALDSYVLMVSFFIALT